MKIIKVVIDNINSHSRRVKESIDMVNAVQNYFLLQFDEHSLALEGHSGNEINAAMARKNIIKKYPDTYSIFVVSNRFTDNWFSHPYRDCSVITIADWEEVFAPLSLRAYLMYHFAEVLLSLEADLSEEMAVRHAHERPRGCISDFVGNKPDVKLGMVAGNLCSECESTFLRYGGNPESIDAIRKILSVVRYESTGRPQIIDTDSAFVVMRFSENDENNNAFLYGVKPGLLEVGINARRGDDKIQSSQILNQVLKYIQRCRFIIAKVDVDNLNVYFELGVAMGIQKDVLLIAESSLVLNLPTDLRNWECLTYEKGNYEQLKKRISSYYVDNYSRTRST